MKIKEKNYLKGNQKIDQLISKILMIMMLVIWNLREMIKFENKPTQKWKEKEFSNMKLIKINITKENIDIKF